MVCDSRISWRQMRARAYIAIAMKLVNRCKSLGASRRWIRNRLDTCVYSRANAGKGHASDFNVRYIILTACLPRREHPWRFIMRTASLTMDFFLSGISLEHNALPSPRSRLLCRPPAISGYRNRCTDSKRRRATSSTNHTHLSRATESGTLDKFALYLHVAARRALTRVGNERGTQVRVASGDKQAQRHGIGACIYIFFYFVLEEQFPRFFHDDRWISHQQAMITEYGWWNCWMQRSTFLILRRITRKCFAAWFRNECISRRVFPPHAIYAQPESSHARNYQIIGMTELLWSVNLLLMQTGDIKAEEVARKKPKSSVSSLNARKGNFDFNLIIKSGWRSVSRYNTYLFLVKLKLKKSIGGN